MPRCQLAWRSKDTKMAGATKTETTYPLPGGEYSATTIQNDNGMNRHETSSRDTPFVFSADNQDVTTPGATVGQHEYSLNNDHAGANSTYNENHVQTSAVESGDGYDRHTTETSTA